MAIACDKFLIVKLFTALEEIKKNLTVLIRFYFRIPFNTMSE